MPGEVIQHYIPTRKQETRANSYRTYLPRARSICWFESYLELLVHHWLDARSGIVEVIPHGYKVNERFGDKKVWTLDSRIRWDDGRENIVEIKPSSQLQENEAGKMVPKDWDLLCQWSAQNGHRPIFFTEQVVADNWQLINNWLRIRPYIQLSHQLPNPVLQERIHAITEQNEEIKLARIVASMPEEYPQSVLSHTFDLFQRGLVQSDLDLEPLSAHTKFWSTRKKFVAARTLPEADADESIPKNCPAMYALNDPIADVVPNDPDTWPLLSASMLPEEQQTLFRKRQRIVVARLVENQRAVDIAKTFGVQPGEVYRLVKRCISPGPTGDPYGWYGIVPNRRLSKSRNDLQKTGPTSRALERLFERFPEIEKLLVDKFLNRRQKHHQKERRIPHKKAWEYFLKLCKKEGIGADEWPFNTSRQGREAIRRYLKRLSQTDIRAYTRAIYGEDIARVLDANRPRVSDPEVRPYAKIQIDGHNINSETSIEVTAPDGTPIRLPAGRALLLIAIDLAENAILSHAVIPYTQHSSEDLLDCVINFLEPWKRPEGIVPSESYRRGAGMPSGIFDQCAWRACDVLQLDNALPHLSREVQERIIETLGCVIHVGLPKTPTTRAIIERVFGTIEEKSFNRLQSTTGIGPKDPRRNRAEEAAVKYHIRLAHIESLVDVTAANINATPTKSTSGRSPLQYIAAWLQKDAMFTRHVPAEIQSDLPLFYTVAREKTIAGNLATGHSGYIEWNYARYKNVRITSDGSLIGSKVNLLVDRRDVRTIHIYTLDGEYLGEARAQNKWCLHKHSLRERLLVGRWMNEQVNLPSPVDPVGDFRDAIERDASTSKRARRRLADQRRRAEKDNHNLGNKSDSKSSRSDDSGPSLRQWVSVRGTMLR